jgi:hypothetical protein
MRRVLFLAAIFAGFNSLSEIISNPVTSNTRVQRILLPGELHTAAAFASQIHF